MGMDAKTAILEQKTALGIEFGSTRIKAVLIGADNAPIASGDHEWENRYDNGVWTYTLEDIWTGLQDAYTKMAADVKEKYDITLTRVGAIGFSAMMHGYMARAVPHLEKQDHRRSKREADRSVRSPHPAEMDYRPSVSGNLKR